MGAFQHLGPALKALREERRLRQREVEAVAGLPKRSLSAYERGHRTPSLSTLERLLTALGATLGDLATELEALQRAGPALRSEPTGRAVGREGTAAREVADSAERLLAMLEKVIHETLTRTREDRETEDPEEEDWRRRA